MIRWLRKNWFTSLIIGAIMYTIHIIVEYVIVDAVLKYAGITISIV